MKILLYPDQRLLHPNELLRRYTSEEADRVAEMVDLMYKYDGVGLAAPQVGWNVQLFVLNTGEKGKERIYINPKIETHGDIENDMEGCLSFPGVFARIKRLSDVRIIADTPDVPVVDNYTGLIARAVQHEMDHLEGMLFIERMTPADFRKHSMTLKRMKSR